MKFDKLDLARAREYISVSRSAVNDRRRDG